MQCSTGMWRNRKRSQTMDTTTKRTGTSGRNSSEIVAATGQLAHHSNIALMRLSAGRPSRLWGKCMRRHFPITFIPLRCVENSASVCSRVCHGNTTAACIAWAVLHRPLFISSHFCSPPRSLVFRGVAVGVDIHIIPHAKLCELEFLDMRSSCRIASCAFAYATHSCATITMRSLIRLLAEIPDFRHPILCKNFFIAKMVAVGRSSIRFHRIATIGR